MAEKAETFWAKFAHNFGRIVDFAIIYDSTDFSLIGFCHRLFATFYIYDAKSSMNKTKIFSHKDSVFIRATISKA